MTTHPSDTPHKAELVCQQAAFGSARHELYAHQSSCGRHVLLRCFPSFAPASWGACTPGIMMPAILTALTKHSAGKRWRACSQVAMYTPCSRPMTAPHWQPPPRQPVSAQAVCTRCARFMCDADRASGCKRRRRAAGRVAWQSLSGAIAVLLAVGRNRQRPARTRLPVQRRR